MKSQVFTSSMIIISILTMMIIFEYNTFYLNSKSKLLDYLILDDMTEISNNHFKILGSIAGNNIYFQDNKGYSIINFESYLRTDYSPINMLNQYKSLLNKNTKGMKINYTFTSFENDLIIGKTQRNISEINLSIIHNYTSDLIIFQNISAINNFNISFSFNGLLNNLTTCAQNVSGKKITITGPSNYRYELSITDNCLINLSAINSTLNDFILIGFNVLSNNLTINYFGVDQFNNMNIKILANTSYENLFKTASAYNNTRIELVKGAFNLSKGFE